MGVNNYSMPGQQEVIDTGSDEMTLRKFGVTNNATLLAPSRSTRRSVWMNNLGGTNLWLGASSNTQVGVSGINFGYVNPGSNLEIRNYRGDIYGIVGGDSISPVWVATADIG
jgi:hypothetical protein